jgi:hypothetical protein
MNLYPALEIIIALGLVALDKNIKIRINKKLYKLFSFCVSGLFLLTILFTVINEYGYSVAINHGEYQPGGFKEGVKILAGMQDKYDEIIIDSPHAQSYIFFLFYQSFPPEIVQSYAEIRPKPGIEGNLNFNFYKYKFEKYNWLEQRNKSKIMIWTSSEVIEKEIKNAKNANLIWVDNAVSKKATAIITKD